MTWVIQAKNIGGIAAYAVGYHAPNSKFYELDNFYSLESAIELMHKLNGTEVKN